MEWIEKQDLFKRLEIQNLLLIPVMYRFSRGFTFPNEKITELRNSRILFSRFELSEREMCKKKKKKQF